MIVLRVIFHVGAQDGHGEKPQLLGGAGAEATALDDAVAIITRAAAAARSSSMVQGAAARGAPISQAARPAATCTTTCTTTALPQHRYPGTYASLFL
eukprot:COSAG06_NODE_258_length_18940_cov_15.039648_6_plen_97_part_00